MDLSLFITPLAGNKIVDYMSAKDTLGSQVCFYKGDEINGDFQLAIIGVKEGRGGHSISCKDSANYFRDHLYSLYPSWKNLNIIDLGNIEEGNEWKDTNYALSEVVFSLVSNNILPVIIGGSNDLGYGVYKGYERLEQTVNLVTVDRKVDLNEEGNKSDTYLRDIILSKPNYLFNYTNLGAQGYFCNPEIEALMEKLFFDNIRLGQIQQDKTFSEPYIRNADIFSFDLNAIRQAEVPGTTVASPNGFFGNEACQLTRYAGMSDKLSSVAFFETTPEYDVNGQTFSLLAQMIWYFIEGFANRKKESPLSSDKNYTKYKVVLNNTQEELTFIKSTKSNRWWMKVPYPPSSKTKFERHHLVPCDYKDYEMAMNDEMPDLWIRTYKKINVY